MKTFYHGTVSTFVPDILKHGLEPKPSNRWRVAITVDGNTFEPDDSDREPAIYLSQKRSLAWKYAVNKTAYYHAKPFESFVWTRLNGYPPVSATKKGDALYLPDSRPVVLTCTIPDTIYRQFKDDYKEGYASLCTCIIPPQYIKAERI